MNRLTGSAAMARVRVFWDRFGETYEAIGIVAGFILGAVAFLGIYVAAVGSAGWVIGLALGWIPAWLGAIAVFGIARYTWPVAAVLAIWLYAALVQ